MMIITAPIRYSYHLSSWRLFFRLLMSYIGGFGQGLLAAGIEKKHAIHHMRCRESHQMGNGGGVYELQQDKEPRHGRARRPVRGGVCQARIGHRIRAQLRLP